jgi:hypothetical protein
MTQKYKLGLTFILLLLVFVLPLTMLSLRTRISGSGKVFTKLPENCSDYSFSREWSIGRYDAPRMISFNPQNNKLYVITTYSPPPPRPTPPARMIGYYLFICPLTNDQCESMYYLPDIGLTSGISIDIDTNGHIYIAGGQSSTGFEGVKRYLITSTGYQFLYEYATDLPGSIVDIAVSGNVLYVLENTPNQANDTIHKYNLVTNQYLGSFSYDTDFINVSEIAVSPQSDFLYVKNHTGEEDIKIHKFTTSGNYLLSFGTYGTEPQGDNLVSVHNMAVSGAGNLFVLNNSYFDRVANIKKFSSEGTWLNTWSSFGPNPWQFSYLSDLTFDSNWNMYVTDDFETRSRITAWNCNSTPPSPSPTPSRTPTPTPRPPTPTPDPRKVACQAGGGIWITGFRNSCRDNCGTYRTQNCQQVISSGCNCGAQKCWNGNSCVPGLSNADLNPPLYED